MSYLCCMHCGVKTVACYQGHVGPCVACQAPIMDEPREIRHRHEAPRYRCCLHCTDTGRPCRWDGHADACRACPEDTDGAVAWVLNVRGAPTD